MEILIIISITCTLIELDAIVRAIGKRIFK